MNQNEGLNLVPLRFHPLFLEAQGIYNTKISTIRSIFGMSTYPIPNAFVWKSMFWLKRLQNWSKEVLKLHIYVYRDTRLRMAITCGRRHRFWHNSSFLIGNDFKVWAMYEQCMSLLQLILFTSWLNANYI